MGRFTEGNFAPITAQKQAEIDLEQNELVTNIGGKNYRVIDGDTIVEIDANGNNVGSSLRLEGVDAREVAKPDYYGQIADEGGLTKGEVGGLEQRYSLWKMLDSGEFDSIIDQGGTYSDDDRRQVRIENKETGKDLAESMVAAGVVGISGLSDQRAVNAKNDARLEEGFLGFNEDKDKWGHLGGWKHETPVVFKGLALNEDWYNPDFYAGIQFDDKNIENWDKDRERGGFTNLSPMSASWDRAWANVQADWGAALDALGTGIESEWLSQVGRDKRIKAGEKLAGMGDLKIQSLSDISENADGYLETAGNALEWLVVNSTMSMPYMIAIAAPAIAAAPFTGGSSLAAGAAITVASAVPSTVLHTGAVWNEVDPENQDKVAAGKAFGAGFAMGILDRVGLGKLGVSPSKVFTKEGQETLVQGIMKQHGLDKQNATLYLNQATKDELAETMNYLGAASKNVLDKSAMFKKNMAAIAQQAGQEGLTEAGQETISYLTASHINGTPIDYDELTKIATEAAIAGAAIGGAYKATGSVLASGGEYLHGKGKELFDLETLNDWQQVYIERDGLEGGNPDGSIADQIDETKAIKHSLYNGGKDVEGHFNIAAESASTLPVWKDFAYDEAGNFNLTPIKALQAAGHYAGRVVNAPLLNWINANDLRENDAIRLMVNRVMKVRDIGGAGKHYEGRRKYLEGQFGHLFNARKIMDAEGIGLSTGKVLKFSQDFRKFGKDGVYDQMKAARKNGQPLSDAELSALGWDPATARRYYKYADDANRASHIKFNLERDSLVREYGKDSDVVKNFEKSRLDGWWWKHQEVDRQKVAADPKGAEALIQQAIDKKLADPNVSPDAKQRIKEKSAHQRVQDILNEDPNSDEFSLVGGTKWGSDRTNERLLDLTEQEGFEAFASDNIFATYDLANERSSKRISHLEYFGDGGSDLDVLFDLAVKREVERGASQDEAYKKVARLAASVKNGIDASSGNYNRIKDPRTNAILRGTASYLALVGLPFSTFASIPEFAVIAIDSMNVKEFANAMKAGVKELSKGMIRSFEKLLRAPIGGIKSETRLVDATQERDIIESLGIDESPSSMFRKLGVDSSLPSSIYWQRALESFFTVIGLKGITRVQRLAAMSVGFDSAFTRLRLLAQVPEGRPLTQEEGRSYAQLAALGMDVDAMLNIMRKGTIYSKDQLAFDPEFAREASNDPDQRVVNENMSTYIQNFIDARIQNPGAFNRPLLFQDPHYSMLTVFNGFLSTFTANIVPKLWNDKAMRGLRKKHPEMSMEAFATMAAMIIMGGAGQATKDYLKYGGTPEWLDDEELLHRAVLSSGIFGQYERIGDMIYPLYGKQEGFDQRIQGQLLGPLGFTLGTAKDAVDAATQGDWDKAAGKALKLTPGAGVFTVDRWRELLGITQ